jgi:hypothetical protein
VLLGHVPEAFPAFPPYRFVILALIMAAQTASNLGSRARHWSARWRTGSLLRSGLVRSRRRDGPRLLLLLRVREPIARAWR